MPTDLSEKRANPLSAQAREPCALAEKRNLALGRSPFFSTIWTILPDV